MAAVHLILSDLRSNSCWSELPLVCCAGLMCVYFWDVVEKGVCEALTALKPETAVQPVRSDHERRSHEHFM